MNNHHGWSGAVSFEGKMYVVRYNTSEVYDLKENRWKDMPSPKECQSGKSLVVFKDKLVLIGAQTGDVGKESRTVQFFDFINHVWIEAKDMDIARYAHSSAVVNSNNCSFNL